jgi:hypothetical protein
MGTRQPQTKGRRQLTNLLRVIRSAYNVRFSLKFAKGGRAPAEAVSASGARPRPCVLAHDRVAVRDRGAGTAKETDKEVD